MQSELSSVIMFVLLLLAAFITNPNEEDFKEHLQTEVAKDADDKICIVTALSLLSAIGSIKRKDYKVCSMYSIYVGDKKIRYLGLFTFFFRLD